MKIVVIGGTGLIGKKLVNKLSSPDMTQAHTTPSLQYDLVRKKH